MSAGDPVEWMKRALADLTLAATSASAHRDWGNSAFHASQAVEKALKAALVVSGIVPPKIHDSNALRDLLPSGWTVKTKHPDLAAMGLYSLIGRYPDDLGPVTGPMAAGARRTAASVYATIKSDLAKRGFNVSAL